MMVTKDRKEMILPAPIAPVETRHAPTSTTRARAALRIKEVMGLTTAMVRSAFRWRAARSALTSPKAFCSHCVRDSARMTLAPDMFSCTLRTRRSCPSCTWVNIGTPFRDDQYTTTASSGSVATSTSVSTGSITAETITPPTSSIGARTPRRCMRSIMLCTL